MQVKEAGDGERRDDSHQRKQSEFASRTRDVCYACTPPV